MPLRGDTRVKRQQTFASEMTTTQKNKRAGKTRTCVSKRPAISDQTQKLDRIFWSPHRQVLVLIEKPLFSSVSSAPPGRSQDTEYE